MKNWRIFQIAARTEARGRIGHFDWKNRLGCAVDANEMVYILALRKSGKGERELGTEKFGRETMNYIFIPLCPQIKSPDDNPRKENDSFEEKQDSIT